MKFSMIPHFWWTEFRWRCPISIPNTAFVHDDKSNFVFKKLYLWNTKIDTHVHTWALSICRYDNLAVSCLFLAFHAFVFNPPKWVYVFAGLTAQQDCHPKIRRFMATAEWNRKQYVNKTRRDESETRYCYLLLFHVYLVFGGCSVATMNFVWMRFGIS